MTAFAKDREFEPCPCCGADALVFDARMEPVLGRIIGMATNEKVDVKLAQRWTCDCWKRVACETCKKCAAHCEHVLMSIQGATMRESNARKKAARREFSEASVALPFDAPEVKVEAPRKNVKGRK